MIKPFTGVFVNYFQIFGFTSQFELDVHKLADIYQTLQKKVHPDKFAHASSQEQLVAVKRSTLINDAYQTLKNPLMRAQYLLELRESDQPNEQASFSDNSFLMRQMELHEMLDDVKHADDHEAAILAYAEVLNIGFQDLAVEMHAHLDKNTIQSNLLAGNNLRKLKFYQKLRVDLDKLEDQLFNDE
jgi:molecular chaperone HscB